MNQPPAPKTMTVERRFDLPIALVIDHFGLPDPGISDLYAGVAAILQAAKTQAVYVKLSAPYRLRGADPKKYASVYLAEMGADWLLWGSDWPWTNHERGRSYIECLGMLRDGVLSENEQRVILQHAPKHLYGFSDA